MSSDPLALSVQRPEMSASRTLWPRQKLALAAILVAVPLLLLAWPLPTLRGFVLVSTFFYVTFTVYKLALIYFSVKSDSEITVSKTEIAALHDEALPVYSVMIPLYHESESVAAIIDSLLQLDYPREKLDIQLLLEEDDQETRGAVARLQIPPEIRLTIVPVSQPRTKPKACNVGLPYARGEYLVIYDAEDLPERDQLKKAVIGFSRCNLNVVCLQSKLNFYNPRFNLFTRWFAAEYSAWFDLALPGLSALRAVIPLGGTSNHFRTQALHTLLGWDAFNVAEDCDLGVRICRAGCTTRMLDTTTWEEACGQLRFWIAQRTRWLKGYMQTYLVHTRHPLKLARDLGWRNLIHFHLLVGGMIACFLLNPIYWVLACLWFLYRLEFLKVLFPGPIFLMGALCLFLGNFAFIYAGGLGCYRRKYFDLVKYALLMPPYWFLMSYAAWRAVWQLAVNPFHWEKTRHGLTGKSAP